MPDPVRLNTILCLEIARSSSGVVLDCSRADENATPVELHKAALLLESAANAVRKVSLARVLAATPEISVSLPPLG